MDNLRYKEAGNDWFIKIFLDESGNETGRTASFADGKGSGTGLFKEMQAWQDLGNQVEPQYTAEELAAKEAEEATNAIAATKSTCIRYLNESEIHVSNDPPYPDDIQTWKDKRKEWRTVLKSGFAQEVPEKPFVKI